MSLEKLTTLQSAALATHKCNELSHTTKMRLEALGIEPANVSSESQAQILIAQAEAAPKQNNSREQDDNSKRRELIREAEILAEKNIFNEMNMVSISNRLILGL